MTLESRVRTLEARERIRELRYGYATHLDAGRWDEWGDLFAESARFEVNDGDVVEGRSAIAAYGRETIANAFEESVHMMANPRIDVDGETASGHWYVHVFFARPNGTAGWHCGEYDETYTVEDGQWRFQRVSVDIGVETDDGVTYRPEYDERRGHDVLRVSFRE